MSTSKESLQHKEYMDNGSPRPKRQGKFKRHCARWWWLHIIVFIAIFLIVLLPVVYVAYPRIAQDDINKSKIHTTNMMIQNPTPSQLDLTLKGFLETASAFHPWLRPFNASLYLVGHEQPFINISVPELLGKNGTQFTTSQVAQISNIGEFTAFCAFLLGLPTLDIVLYGHGDLKLGGLPTTTVTYNQTVSLAGLNALKGTEVTEFHLGGGSLPFNANSHGNATVPNPTGDTFDFGDVSLNMFVDDIAIGNATLPGLTMTPGNNSYPLYATANQTSIVKVLAQPKYRCGVFPVTMKGNASIFGGEVLPYFTTAFQASNTIVQLNLTDTLKEAGLSQLITGACESS
ncbi:hypothetical protein K461DRAFT_292281 [Myriangium duriaei CBS 260.36]|uniref:Uncharacterized protein n=1 Tax=Myriangium duriaei CBS 260.36 TaxID=1168546 RepID=A0A9P4J681_9PEZI|nr:hypothetical protein K461DRAFT_292281 [Myriangium duriaei CBS 260.36]